MHKSTETNQQDINCANLDLNLTAVAGLSVGLHATSAVIGALMLPYYGHLAGGLGMIAATAAVVASFSILFAFSLKIGTNLIFKEDFRENNPIIYNILYLGNAIASLFITSMVMGQPLLPLIVCTSVGALAMAGSALLVTLSARTAASMCKNTPNDEKSTYSNSP